MNNYEKKNNIEEMKNKNIRKRLRGELILEQKKILIFYTMN